MSEAKVKFEFTVSLIDAQNIMSLFQSQISRDSEQITEEMCHGNSSEIIQAYKAQISYLRELKSKVITYHIGADNDE